MTQSLESISGDTSALSALTFDDVLAHVSGRAAEFTQKRHVPTDMIDEFRHVGIYRASTPRRFGGDALPPGDFLRMVERISEADGSAGWVASFGLSGVYLAALPVETQAQLYASRPDLVFAAGLFPVQPAQRVGDNFVVTGRWRFASGCKGADFLGVGIGADDAGNPRTAVIPAERVRIVENWDVVGMEGTGSHDLTIDNVAVPESWTFVRGNAPRVDDALYRYPSVAFASQGLAVVNLGIARAALDYVIGVGSGRTSLTGAPKLSDRAYYRVAVAKAEAELRSVRAFFYEITDEVYATVAEGNSATVDQISLLRLAAAQAARVGSDVVRAAYTLSGTAAINLSHPLQRYLRDASVVPQHAFLTEAMYDSAGSVLMGVEPIPGYV